MKSTNATALQALHKALAEWNQVVRRANANVTDPTAQALVPLLAAEAKRMEATNRKLIALMRALDAPSMCELS